MTSNEGSISREVRQLSIQILHDTQLNSYFPKFRILPIARSTSCRLLKKCLNGYISKNWEARWVKLTPHSVWCPCFLGTQFHVSSYYGYKYIMINNEIKKKHFHIFQAKKAKTLAANYLGLGHTWLYIWCFRNAYFELIWEKKKNLNKSKSIEDNSRKSNLEQVIYRYISVSFKFKIQNGKNNSKIKVKISMVDDIV